MYFNKNLLKKYENIFKNGAYDYDFNIFLEKNSYNIINDSNLFDEDYYRANYPDTIELDLDSIEHYLRYGVYENCNPNDSFNTKNYFSENKDKLQGLNPFVHYILYGDGNIAGSIIREINKNRFSNETFLDIINAFEKEISIIIPIFNAYEDTKKCIESVLEHTTVKFKLILIDDKSTDSRISELLDEYENFKNILIIRNKVNKGFTKNVNIGIKNSSNDVILLNSDTIVTPRWVQKIIISAYSDKLIGTLTPISNASDISVPVMNQNNEIPSFLNVDSMSLLVEKVSANGNLIAPTGNGFCLFIKRDVINDVGLFDEDNFGKGYGEETDFTMRAKSKGWKNARNDSIFIYHKRSASFSLNKANDLKEKHKTILLSRYPKMFEEWGDFVNSKKLMESVESVDKYINNFNENLTKQNILYITSLRNGIPKIDDVTALSTRYNLFILTLDEFKFKFWVVKGNEFIFIDEFLLNNKYPNFHHLNSYYLSLLKSLCIDFLFVQFNNSFKFLNYSPFCTPVILASKLGLPIFYGENSYELKHPLINIKSNKELLSDYIIENNEKGVVYTALFGDYEDLLDPKIVNDDWDYICFTDNPNLKSDVWEIRLIDDLEWDVVRNARTIKILPHMYLREYDYSIWVDAGFQIIGDLKQYIKEYSQGKSMLGVIHSDRDCLYEEANACINAKKDDEKIINDQINRYKQNHFPEHFGLIETGILFRRHNDSSLIKVMEDWHSEVINFSKRDQLSLTYVLWKNNFEMDKARIFYWKNSYFEHFFHQKFDSNDKIHIFIIKDENYDAQKTIDSLMSFSTKIPITLVEYEHNNIITPDGLNINEYIENINENFLMFLHSGELITNDLFKYISSNDFNSVSNFGAIVFDADNYYSNDFIYNFKPNFSLDLFLEYDYIKNAVILNKNAILSVGGFNTDFNKNFIRDVILRLYQSDYNIHKKDFIGFKLKSFDEIDDLENRLLIDNFLNNNHIDAEICQNPIKPIYNTFNKKASIIIPFKDKPEVTEKCVSSILNKTDYLNYEIILVNNNSYEDETFVFMDKYRNHEKILIIDYTDIFNYSKLNNYATKFASGDVFIFLNNDTEVVSENWLSLLIGDAIQENVGAVGAKLYYPDYSIQHIGVVIGLNGLAGHVFNGELDENIPQQFIKYRRNVSAVTGACMAIQRKVFEHIGGFDELFDITGSDVEICLRLLDYGYRNILNPSVQLIHHEKKTRSRIRVRDIDIKLSIVYYGPYLDEGDPYFNSHFSLNSNKICLKQSDEIPIFKEFLEKYGQQKSAYNNKINEIFKLKTHINNVKKDAEVIAYDVSKEELDDNAILMNNFFKNPTLELNTVVWFIPWFDHIIRGGIYTIFRIANHFTMSENTHNIFVLKTGRRRNLDELKKEIHDAFPNLDFEVIDLDKFGSISDLPSSDAAFCTLWTTAYSLVKYNNCKAKFYLNQDYEPLFSAAGSVYGLIEETYRFKFIGLANTKGVGDKYESYGNVVKYFTPAVDKTLYYPGSSDDSKKRVVFYGRPLNPRNGFILGIEALKMVKAYFGDSVEIFSAGAEFDLNEYGLDGVITNLGLLDSIEEVADLYRKCDVGLVFMFTPHPSYQPLEYMACGCATVTNINESNMWLLKDKENAILSEPVISCVAENIINLLNDDNMRNNIIQNGIKTIEKIDWDSQLINIVDFVKNPLNNTS